MAEVSLITDEMRALIGIESEPGIDEIEKGAIRKFADALGDTNPLYHDEEYAKKTKYGGIIAPPTFFCTLQPGPGKELNAPQLTRKLNGGSEFEIFQVLRPGDVISTTVKLAELTERDGKMGKMLFRTIELTYKNQKGELVGKGRNTLILY
ncbi:MAG: MaoC family dehydratase N-terminal domain-containing protein [Dehalococcoidia bacterium]|nr:MaoC family dehydratase N-terminal domain-containing protein [Dehalococcoidia bacterium]